MDGIAFFLKKYFKIIYYDIYIGNVKVIYGYIPYMKIITYHIEGYDYQNIKKCLGL